MTATALTERVLNHCVCLTAMVCRNNLRHELRAKRNALPQQVQQEAAESIVKQLLNARRFRRSHRIGAYFPIHSELNCLPLIAVAKRLGKHIYLPCILPSGELRFSHWNQNARLQCNRLAIPEPKYPGCAHIKAKNLDLVLVPLVGFDRNGHRLGMGGGFYDRTFAWLRNTPRPRRPYLLGLAHNCQYQPRLNRGYWDVKLDGAVTPSRMWYFSR